MWTHPTHFTTVGAWLTYHGRCMAHTTCRCMAHMSRRVSRNWYGEADLRRSSEGSRPMAGASGGPSLHSPRSSSIACTTCRGNVWGSLFKFGNVLKVVTSGFRGRRRLTLSRTPRSAPKPVQIVWGSDVCLFQACEKIEGTGIEVCGDN